MASVAGVCQNGPGMAAGQAFRPITVKLLAIAFCLLAFSASAQTNVPVKATVTHFEVRGRTIHYDQHPNGIEQTVYYECIDRSVVTYTEGKVKRFATNDVASTNKVIIAHQVREGSEWVDKVEK